MAVKEKNVEKQSKLKEILVTEYKWENLLLLVLATLSIALALIIIINKGPISIDPNFPVIGKRSTQLIFAWGIFAVAMIGLGLVVAPFIAPAIPELKKVTWATKAQFLDHAVRVIIFILIFIFVIMAFDIIVIWLLNLINSGV